MIFFVQTGITVKPEIYPAFVLKTDNWDDFGHVCKFHLHYYASDSSRIRIGSLKILPPLEKKKEMRENFIHTKLPKSFSKLEGYISLGQDNEYYRNLHQNLELNEIECLMKALGDIAWEPSLADPFETSTAFRNALMRENGAQRARRFGKLLALGEDIRESYSFSYEGSIPRAAAPVETYFPFDDDDDDDEIPGRIAAIVGRNAVGKTQFLANLARDLTHVAKTSSEKQKIRENRFKNGRPLFTRVIALSYSAFDKFARPKDPGISYVYCGIRSENGGLSRRHLISTYLENQARIKDAGKTAQWVEYMEEVLGEINPTFARELLSESADTTDDDNALQLLSSGQAILVHFVTALLAWIEPGSLVLFDEPETHLHPNAVASLFNVLHKILRRHQSFSIIATHSPVVLQEIPGRFVLVFQRNGDLTTAEPLGLESFGESITELTRHVFETSEIDSLYRRTLRKLAKYEAATETLGRFENGLSLNAQAYLIAQHAKKKK